VVSDCGKGDFIFHVSLRHVTLPDFLVSSLFTPPPRREACSLPISFRSILLSPVSLIQWLTRANLQYSSQPNSSGSDA
jgi:hypothetical protein